MKRISFFLLISSVAVHLTFSGILRAETLGDVNGDGKINLLEAIYALQISSGIRPNNTIYVATKYFPLTAGNTWQYHGSVTSETDTYCEYTYKKVLGEEQFNGVPCVKVKNDVEVVTDENENMYFRITDEGIKLMGWYHIEDIENKWETIIYEPPVMYLKAEFRIDDTWRTETTVSHSIDGIITKSYHSAFSFKVMRTEDLFLPSGSFLSSLKIQMTIENENEPDEINHLWLAQAVGEVKKTCESDGATRYIDDLQYAIIEGISYGIEHR